MELEPGILILDAETTGLEQPIGIVEIAWRLLDFSMNLLSKYDTLVNPEMDIPADATAVHGIRNEDVIGMPTIDKVFFPECPVVLVCHNIIYDKPLVEEYLNIDRELCSMLTARRLLQDVSNHKLVTLAAELELSRTIPHRAPSDVLVLHDLINYLLEGLGWNFMQLLEFYEKPFVFKTMPIGRHKGRPCSEVPRPYWYWVLGEEFDRDMRLSAEYYLRKEK